MTKQQIQLSVSPLRRRMLGDMAMPSAPWRSPPARLSGAFSSTAPHKVSTASATTACLPAADAR